MLCVPQCIYALRKKVKDIKYPYLFLCSVYVTLHVRVKAVLKRNGMLVDDKTHPLFLYHFKFAAHKQLSDLAS